MARILKKKSETKKTTKKATTKKVATEKVATKKASTKKPVAQRKTKTAKKSGRRKVVVRRMLAEMQVAVQPETDSFDELALYPVELLSPVDIDIGWRARTDLGDMSGLVRSIAEIGQLHPIRVARNGAARPSLIAGYRRLVACKQLKRQVRAEVVPADDEALELKRQLHENLRRKDFDPLEEGEGLRRLKVIYERLHPETKQGRGRHSKTDGKRPERFTLQASRELGMSERKVQELIEVANLPAPYKKKIKAATTTADRSRVARECIQKVRENRKIQKLEDVAEKKRQTTIDEQLEASKGPSIVLHHGENTDFFTVANQFDLILTDPPYDRERSMVSHTVRASINPEQHQWDQLDVGWVLPAAHTLRPGGQMIVFCPLEAIGSYELAFQAAELEYRQALLWLKSNPAPVHRNVYATGVEAIVWATKPGARYYFNSQMAKAGAESLNVFSGPGVPGSAKDRLHPTQKPEWLIEKLLENHADQDAHVCDPFAGSGTTGVVCQRLKLPCTMIERDEEFVKRARVRMEAAR